MLQDVSIQKEKTEAAVATYSSQLLKGLENYNNASLGKANNDELLNNLKNSLRQQCSSSINPDPKETI